MVNTCNPTKGAKMHWVMRRKAMQRCPQRMIALNTTGNHKVCRHAWGLADKRGQMESNWPQMQTMLWKEKLVHKFGHNEDIQPKFALQPSLCETLLCCLTVMRFAGKITAFFNQAKACMVPKQGAFCSRNRWCKASIDSVPAKPANSNTWSVKFQKLRTASCGSFGRVMDFSDLHWNGKSLEWPFILIFFFCISVAHTSNKPTFWRAQWCMCCCDDQRKRRLKLRRQNQISLKAVKATISRKGNPCLPVYLAPSACLYASSKATSERFRPCTATGLNNFRTLLL